MTALPPLRRRGTDQAADGGLAGHRTRTADGTDRGEAEIAEGGAGGRAARGIDRPDGGDRAADLARLHRYLARLVADGFYGKVTVSFQNGRACDVRIEQTHKLDEL